MANIFHRPRNVELAHTESLAVTQEVPELSSMSSGALKRRHRVRHRKHKNHKSTQVLDAGLGTAQQTAQTTTSSTSAPSCPAGNGTIYADSFNIAYEIFCGRDYTFVTNKILQVKSGGYAQCFTACSTADNCAGFSFNGEESGTCFLKGHVPDSTRSFRGRQWVSCAKIDPNAAASMQTTSFTSSTLTLTHTLISSTAATSTHNPYPLPSSAKSNPGRNSNVGAIVGGTLGAIAAIACIVAVAWFTRRRRNNKVREGKEHKSPRISVSQSQGTLTSLSPAPSPPLTNHAGKLGHSPIISPPLIPQQSPQSLPSSVYKPSSPPTTQCTPRPESLTRDIVGMLHEPSPSAFAGNIDRRTQSPRLQEDIGGSDRNTFKGARADWLADSPILPSSFQGRDRQESHRNRPEDVRQKGYLHPRGYF